MSILFDKTIIIFGEADRETFNSIVAPQIDSETGIMGSAEDILSLFRAQFGVISLNEEAKTIGVVEDSRELMAVVGYLRRKRYK